MKLSGDVLDLGEIDLVIFDLDGTLIDSGLDIAIEFQRVMMKHKLTVLTSREIIQSLGKHPQDIFFRSGADPSNLDFLVKEFRKNLFDSKLTFTKLFPGVEDLLKYLRSNNVQLCIATTKPTNLAFQTCAKMGISEYFGLIQGSEGIPHKPNPAVIIKCLEQIQHKRAIYVGDTDDDIVAARSANIDCIALDHGSRSIEVLRICNPYALFPTIRDFYNNLQGESHA